MVERVFRFLDAADDLHNNYYRMPMDRAILTACLIYPILEQELKRQYLDKDKIPHFGEIFIITIRSSTALSHPRFPTFPVRSAP